MNSSCKVCIWRTSLWVAIFLLPMEGYANYLEYSYQSQHFSFDFLPTTSTHDTFTNVVSADFSSWRRTPTGFMARGPIISLQQGDNYEARRYSLPLYQWHRQQGLWLEFKQQKWRFNTQLEQSAIYLPNRGIPLSLAANQTITSDAQYQYWQLYWHESVRQEGPINRVGFHYLKQEQVVTMDYIATNANLFDGRFEGWGVQIGRVKQDKGFNFEWLVKLSQLQSYYSSDAIDHRSQAKADSQDFQLDLTLNWHYRYYLAPYWYAVPRLGVWGQYQMQSQFEADTLEHEAYTAWSYFYGISLQRRF